MSQKDFSVAGNLRVIGSTVITGQVAIGGTSLNLSTFANDMIANITAANANIASVSTAVNSAITSTNVSMKNYVDSTVISAIIAASGYGNAVVEAYLPVDSTITSLQSNTVSLQSNSVSIQANIVAANVRIASHQANLLATNLVLSSTDSNVSYLQGVAQYVTANIVSNGAVIASNVYTNNGSIFSGTGNLTIGNINASGNLIMAGADATTIRFVRSPDDVVTSGEIYGNIDWAGEDATPNASGARARISATAIDTRGAADIKFYTSSYGTGGFFGGNGTGYGVAPRFTVNSQGYFGATAGFEVQVIPPIQDYNYFYPATNDAGNPSNGITSVITGAVARSYGSVNAGAGVSEYEIGQQFQTYYVGFAGGDRANINLGGVLDSGVTTLIGGDSYTTDIEIYVQGSYFQDPSVNPPVMKRLRKRWIATVTYVSSTGNWSILDQQLCEAVYNSDAVNWPAGAASAGKVFIQANATPGYQNLFLRFDSPTSPVATSTIRWQWTAKFRNN
jgi:hypothetical protein